MESVAAIIQSLAGSGDELRATIPESWLQGRTAYGGLSAALALGAAHIRVPDLPPLRSAQIAFIGPLAGEVRLDVRVLRRGRTAAYVQSDVYAGDSLGLRAMLVFMHAQSSHVDLAPGVLAKLPPKGARFSPPPSIRFARHFELLDGRGDQDRPAEIVRWARLRDRESLDPAIELLAIGDGLPPAAMTLFQRHGPISSMTWQINLLADPPVTHDGWWLLGAVADHAQDGSSSQAMTIHNSAGALVATGMQSVALFV